MVGIDKDVWDFRVFGKDLIQKITYDWQPQRLPSPRFYGSRKGRLYIPTRAYVQDKRTRSISIGSKSCNIRVDPD